MTKMQKRPNMQVVGMKIAQFRRQQGLSVYAFARELEQPIWLITLVESAQSEHSSQLIDLLPNSVIEALLREIHEVYGVSNRWLTTRWQSPKHPPLPEGDVPQEPLLLPIALSPEDAVAFLDDLLKLSLLDPRSMPERESCLRQSIKAASLLYQLRLANLQKNGHDELASQHSQQFNELLRQRIEHWEKELNITDSTLDESSPE